MTKLQKENASPDRRWELWKKDYAFAAVPPTAAGDQIARQLLDEAWPKFPGALAQMRGGAASITPDPHATAERIAALLQPEKPIQITLIDGQFFRRLDSHYRYDRADGRFGYARHAKAIARPSGNLLSGSAAGLVR